GAAALHPSAPDLIAPIPDTQFRLTRERLLGLATCAIMAPSVLAVEGSHEGVRDITLLSACSGAVFLMVMLRLLDLSRRHEAALGRATALAAAGVGLVEARAIEDVIAVARSAGQAMLHAAGSVEITFADAPAQGDGAIVLPVQGRRERHGTLIA